MSSRYDAEAHLRWLATNDLFTACLQRLARDGYVDRLGGLPLRERDVDDVDGRTMRDWRGAQRGALKGVLPASLHDCIYLLVATYDCWSGPQHPADVSFVQVAPGKSIDHHGQKQRLQALCNQRLDPDGAPMNEKDRAFKSDMLRVLDPEDVLVPVDSNGLPLKSGDLIYGSATAPLNLSGQIVAYPQGRTYPKRGEAVVKESGVFMDPCRRP